MTKLLKLLGISSIVQTVQSQADTGSLVTSNKPVGPEDIIIDFDQKHPAHHNQNNSPELILPQPKPNQFENLLETLETEIGKTSSLISVRRGLLEDVRDKLNLESRITDVTPTLTARQMHNKYPEFSEAVKAMYENKYDQAHQILDQFAQKRKPDSLDDVKEIAEIYRHKGICKLMLNDPEAAMKELDTAQVLSSPSQKINFERGITFIKLGLLEKARNCFDEVLDSSQNSHANSLLFRGIVNKALGDEQKGEDDLKNAQNILDNSSTKLAAIAASVLALAAGVYISEMYEKKRDNERRIRAEQEEAERRIRAEEEAQAKAKEGDKSLHRTDTQELINAINYGVVEPIFTYLEVDQQTSKDLSQKTKDEIGAICDNLFNDLKEAKNEEEAKKIFAEKYSQTLTENEIEFFSTIFQQAVEFTKTYRINSGFSSFTRNHVYEAAISKPENHDGTRYINPEKLQEYLEIYRELVKERTVSAATTRPVEATQLDSRSQSSESEKGPSF